MQQGPQEVEFPLHHPQMDSAPFHGELSTCPVSQPAYDEAIPRLMSAIPILKDARDNSPCTGRQSAQVHGHFCILRPIV
jgi:hypothetical protein